MAKKLSKEIDADKFYQDFLNIRKLAGFEKDKEADITFQDTSLSYLIVQEKVEKILKDKTKFILKRKINPDGPYSQPGYLGSELEIREIPEAVVIVYEKYNVGDLQNYFAIINFSPISENNLKYRELKSRLEELSKQEDFFNI